MRGSNSRPRRNSKVLSAPRSADWANGPVVSYAGDLWLETHVWKTKPSNSVILNAETINDYCKIQNNEMFQSFGKQNTISSADQRERERKKREEGGGEEGCQKVEKQEPIRAWDLVYDVIMRSSIPVALSYMFLFYLGESKH